jgi:isoquinoline 1-oxidoreductase subunit beta
MSSVSSAIDRRTFFRVSSAAVGGLFVSLHFEDPIAAQQPPAVMVFPPAAFVHVRPDDRVVIQINRLEFGQGIHTALAMILADEIDADWSKVIAELAPAADVYKDPVAGMQITGGSGSIAHSFQQYRELGAKTRAMLIVAAANQWQVPLAECRAQTSVVHGPGGRTASYAELAPIASLLEVPATAVLKTPDVFTLIGRRTKRLDSGDKCNGTQRFGIDFDAPGIKVALVSHPPVFGGRVRSVDDAAARRVQGVREVFEIPLVRGTGVAIVADGYWAAKQGRDRLAVEWDLSDVPLPDTGTLFQQYRELARTAGLASAQRGDARQLETISPDRRIVAEFEFPYLAHTPMEPLNTTILFDGDRAEAWVGAQMPGIDQAAIAEVLGIPQDRVTFHTEMAGGGFGRRGILDAHVQREAAAIARRLRGTPVKLIWSREDDVQGGYYRPMQVHRVEVGIGRDGLPHAWRHVIVGQSIYADTSFASQLQKNGIDPLAVEGVADTPYAIPHLDVSAHHPKINVPPWVWRSVGHSHTAYVMETLIDELATRARMDPILYRMKLLNADATRLRATLALLQQRASWRTRLASGHAVGIASHECFGTAVACAVDVSIENGRPRIHRATITVHAGMVVNPLTVESQVQGGAVFGLTQLMANGRITLANGRVVQRNFDSFIPPYIKDTPVAIDVHTVPSSEPPSGCGEPGVPVISPAVANALSALTAKRYRSLPLVAI